MTKFSLRIFQRRISCKSNPIRKWRHNPNKHKHDDKGMYFVSSLASTYLYISAMMCRLFVPSNRNKFSIEWVPLMEVVSDSYIMDWGNILSSNITSQILCCRNNCIFTCRTVPPFFMSAYIMGTVCLTSDFPKNGWKLTIQDPTPIHVYNNILLESKY